MAAGTYNVSRPCAAQGLLGLLLILGSPLTMGGCCFVLRCNGRASAGRNATCALSSVPPKQGAPRPLGADVGPSLSAASSSHQGSAAYFIQETGTRIRSQLDIMYLLTCYRVASVPYQQHLGRQGV